MKLRVEHLRTIFDDEIRDSLWSAYQRAFAGTGLSIQDQLCYDEQTFNDALLDPDYLKLVLLNEADRPVGLALLTDNLEKARITYMDPDRLRAQYPEYAADGRLWYITSLLVDPTAQGGKHSAMLIHELTQYCVEHDLLYGFDFAADKHPKFVEYLRHFVALSLKNSGQDDREPFAAIVGSQTYAVMNTPKKKA